MAHASRVNNSLQPSFTPLQDILLSMSCGKDWFVVPINQSLKPGAFKGICLSLVSLVCWYITSEDISRIFIRINQGLTMTRQAAFINLIAELFIDR